MKPITIAVDGPAASGKSTVGQKLANALGYLYFDTGVMYRALTWAALDRNIPIEDEDAIIALAEQLQIDVEPPTVADGRQYTVLADGRDITWAIREPAVNENVSPVSAYGGVRQALMDQQRRIGTQGGVVMVGRDIGSVILPEAELKVYLDASLHERARRRFVETQQRGEKVSFDETVAAIQRRDQIDSSREIAPLTKPDGALDLDTTRMDVDEVVEAIIEALPDASADIAPSDGKA